MANYAGRLPWRTSNDVFGNLRTVTQGVQTRTFTYDSLSHLRSASNPESGTITYTYDDNGNLTQKVDARPVTTNFVYDALNRLTSRTYTDSTPSVTYAYDAGAGVSNPIGKLIAVTSSVSSYRYSSYDAIGRIVGGAQTLGGQTYSMGYTYDLAGHVTSMTYPSGRTVTNTYDAVGRLTSLAGNLGDGTTRTYATGIIYDAAGRMKKEQLGTDTPVFNKLWYNSRGQLAEIRESTNYTGEGDTSRNRGAIINHYSNYCWGMCAGQSMPDNNGNVQRQEHMVPDEQGTTAQSYLQGYTYDSLNRLQSVTEGRFVLGEQNPRDSVTQTNVFDRWGNRTIDHNATSPVLNPTEFSVDTSNNRLGVPSGHSGTMIYDAAGNLTTDTYSGAAVTRDYDAENRMTKETQALSFVAGSYSYDADGHRVKRTVKGTTTWQVYGMGGELLAEYAANNAASSPQKEYGYRNGQLLVTATAADVTAPDPPGTRVNVASAANGGTASAQNYTQDSAIPGSYFEPSYAIDGIRYSPLTTAGNDVNKFWRDEHGLSSWLEVDFNGSKTIDEVDVFNVGDYATYMTQADPASTQTFSTHGNTAFDVQYWTGSAWATVPSGTITGNNLVWAKTRPATATVTSR